jgi:hypothetical protein
MRSKRAPFPTEWRFFSASPAHTGQRAALAGIANKKLALRLKIPYHRGHQ